MLGLEVELLRALTLPTARREQVEGEFLAHLDEYAEGRCPDEEVPELEGEDFPSSPGGGMRSMLRSRGLWLNGEPQNPSDLQRLHRRLNTAARSDRPLDFFWQTAEPL